MVGVTLDTGALIALEEVSTGRSTNAVVLQLAKALRSKPRANEDRPIVATTPSVVYAEWSRGQKGPAAKLIDSNGIDVEYVDQDIAHRVGNLLAAAKKSHGGRENLLLVDAIVVVTAELRRDVIYTSDVGDLEYLRDIGYFDVKILRI